MSWKYFCGACVVVGGALIKAGAPVLAIVAGMGLAAVVNLRRYRGKPVDGSAGLTRRV